MIVLEVSVGLLGCRVVYLWASSCPSTEEEEEEEEREEDGERWRKVGGSDAHVCG